MERGGIQAVRRLLVRALRGVLRGFCFHLPLRSCGRPVRVPVLRGVGLELCRAITHREDAWKTDLFRRLVPLKEGLFVDIGANLGQTLIALRSVDQEMEYLGFEPIPECVDYMNTLIRVNRFAACTVLACGLSDTAGVCELHRCRDSATDSGATVRSDLRPGRRLDTIKVPVAVFDDLRDGVANRPVALVKVDVEGAELEVLTGMRRTLLEDRPPVLCEVLFTDPSADLEAAGTRNRALMRLLDECGYTARQLIKTGDGTQVSEARRIEALESGYWSGANADLCDYLFLPEDLRAAALGALRLPVNSR